MAFTRHSKTAMPRSADKSTRRAFLGDTLKIGAGSLLVGAALRGRAEGVPPGAIARFPMITELPGLPSRVFVDHDGPRLGPADRQGSRFSSGRTAVELTAAS